MSAYGAGKMADFVVKLMVWVLLIASVLSGLVSLVAQSFGRRAEFPQARWEYEIAWNIIELAQSPSFETLPQTLKDAYALYVKMSGDQSACKPADWSERLILLRWHEVSDGIDAMLAEFESDIKPHMLESLRLLHLAKMPTTGKLVALRSLKTAEDAVVEYRRKIDEALIGTTYDKDSGLSSRRAAIDKVGMTRLALYQECAKKLPFADACQTWLNEKDVPRLSSQAQTVFQIRKMLASIPDEFAVTSENRLHCLLCLEKVNELLSTYANQAAAANLRRDRQTAIVQSEPAAECVQAP